jgi:hypothetical protein
MTVSDTDADTISSTAAVISDAQHAAAAYSASHPEPAAPSAVEIVSIPEGTIASEPYIDVRVSIPARIAAALRHRTDGRLTLDEAASMVLQLYADAPLATGSHTLTSDQWAALATILDFSPQTADQLVAAVGEMSRVSVGGVRLQLTAEDISIMNARNALGLSPKEYLKHLWTEVMFPAWKNGVIG